MHAVEIVLACFAAAVNVGLARRSTAVWLGLTIWTTLSLSTLAADAARIFEWLPGVAWIRAGGVFWFVISTPMSVLLRLGTKPAKTDPSRRQFLGKAAAIAAAPAAGVAFAIRGAHRDASVSETSVLIPSLPADLEGLRLVQISDIHLGPFFSRDQLRRVIEQANGLGADLALITGDLITSYGDPLHEALQELSRLRSTAGIYGCLGNHEILARAEEEATRAGRRLGVRFLRDEAESLRFGQARLNLAGVDYQRKSKPYLEGASRLVQSDAVNLLLSHNPDVFPVASRQGWDLTLAGHTHGGQVTLEFLHSELNPARFYTPFTYGLYQQGSRAMFVTSGLGTVGVPARLGTSPEIALIRLLRA